MFGIIVCSGLKIISNYLCNTHALCLFHGTIETKQCWMWIFPFCFFRCFFVLFFFLGGKVDFSSISSLNWFCLIKVFRKKLKPLVLSLITLISFVRYFVFEINLIVIVWKILLNDKLRVSFVFISFVFFFCVILLFLFF